MSEIFLDTETTGLSFERGHKIVEIACVETKDFIPTGKVFHKLINPKREVPEEAFKVHGFSEKFLSQKETFDLIADDFLDFIKGKNIIIHNAPFDVSFLNGELNAIKKDLIDKKLVIDSLELARNKYPGSSNSLDNLCKKFNIDISKRTKHNALLDCELLREVYINLVDVKEPKFNLSSDNTIYKFSKNEPYNKEIVKITNSEIELHKQFLKKDIEITSIDPMPRRGIDVLCDNLHRKPLEDMDLGLFETLEAGDVVFVDNSHRSFMNSDVTVFMMDVLPRIPSGVLVGIHDIFLPYDYHEKWKDRYYNEQYLLACMLLANPDYFTIELPLYWAHQKGLDKALEPVWNSIGPDLAQRTGSAFWAVKN